MSAQVSGRQNDPLGSDQDAVRGSFNPCHGRMVVGRRIYRTLLKTYIKKIHEIPLKNYNCRHIRLFFIIIFYFIIYIFYVDSHDIDFIAGKQKKLTVDKKYRFCTIVRRLLLSQHIFRKCTHEYVKCLYALDDPTISDINFLL